ncbi:MAG: MraY family glycosyltransferase [Oligoflexales bacterium]
MSITLVQQSALFNLIPFGTSLLISTLTIPLIRKFALTYHLYNDTTIHNQRYGNLVRQDGLSSLPTPHYGGIGVVFAFFISTFLWLSPQAYAGVFLCSLAVFLLGVTDDIHPLPARFRLLLQCLLAWAVSHTLQLNLNEIIITPNLILPIPPPVGQTLAILVIVGGINSINMIDGMDGLAGGISLIGFISLSLLHSIVSGSSDSLLLLALPFTGSILGFLSYNTYPASIFMGDSGSNWLGFMLGVLLLMLFAQSGIPTDGTPYTKISMISALCCIGVPIIDTAAVIFLRIRSGKSPFNADNRHFHHTLLGLGFNTRQSVTVIYLISVLLAIGGVLPALFPNSGLDWVPWVLFSFTIAMVASAPLKRKYAQNFQFVEKEPSRNYLKFLYTTESLTLYALYTLFILSATAPQNPQITSMIALIPMVTLLIGAALIREQRKTDFLSCFLIALAGMTLLASSFADTNVTISALSFKWLSVYKATLIFMSITTCITVSSSITRCLKALTPTDLLVFLIFLTTLALSVMAAPDLALICSSGLAIFISTRTLVTIPEALFRIRALTFLCLVIAMGKLFYPYLEI